MTYDKQRKKLTIVVPIYNEEDCIHELIRRLKSLTTLIDEKITIEYLFINDGSIDNSLELLTEHASKDSLIKVISLSRNFGHQIAVSAGLDHAEGDYVAIIDADLQDPPELIADMYSIIINGYDIVYAQRRQREGESWFKKITAKLFYRTLNILCNSEIPNDTGDFRIISKRVAEVISSMPEKHRFIRGLIPWTGYKSRALLYDRDKRYAGTTKYPIIKMLNLAIDAIISFSNRPLQLATKLGTLTIILAFFGILYMLYIKLFTSLPVPGITVTVVTILFMGGIQILLIGLIGEYVAKIFEQVKNRPLYLIEKTINLESSPVEHT